MNQFIAENFLKSFFRLFDAIIKECKYDGKTVAGQVVWADDKDDTQTFRWYIEVAENDVTNMKLLCDYLYKNKFIEIDRIIVSEPELIEELKSNNWEIKDIKSALHALMSTEVKMIDDDEETDSFFIHF